MNTHPHRDAEHGPDPLFDTVVIGGGQAGLAMAWHLKRQGQRFLVLDAGPAIGHTWRSRWDSLVLFTPAQYDSLPGMPFPAPADTYPTKDQAADYLQAYAAAFDLPVRPNSRVTRLRRTGDVFEVRTVAGVVTARQVVIATGPFATPFVPPLARTLDEAVVQLHSAEYRNPADLPHGRVLVVGAGNSGMQIAAELAKTRPVELAVGTRSPSLPQRLLGRDLFWWVTHTRLSKLSADSRLGRRLKSRETINGTTRRQLRRAGVTVRPRLLQADGKTARFADGRSRDISGVVWATGYQPDYSWLDIPDVLDDGRPVHQRGITNIPGLYFLGLPWQHTRGSALLGFVKDDAAYLADRLIAGQDGTRNRCVSVAGRRTIDREWPQPVLTA
jgi:putative flavoprotein involved in K+ transport